MLRMVLLPLILLVCAYPSQTFGTPQSACSNSRQLTVGRKLTLKERASEDLCIISVLNTFKSKQISMTFRLSTAISNSKRVFVFDDPDCFNGSLLMNTESINNFSSANDRGYCFIYKPPRTGHVKLFSAIFEQEPRANGGVAEKEYPVTTNVLKIERSCTALLRVARERRSLGISMHRIVFPPMSSLKVAVNKSLPGLLAVEVFEGANSSSSIPARRENEIRSLITYGAESGNAVVVMLWQPTELQNKFSVGSFTRVGSETIITKTQPPIVFNRKKILREYGKDPLESDSCIVVNAATANLVMKRPKRRRVICITEIIVNQSQPIWLTEYKKIPGLYRSLYYKHAIRGKPLRPVWNTDKFSLYVTATKRLYGMTVWNRQTMKGKLMYARYVSSNSTQSTPCDMVLLDHRRGKFRPMNSQTAGMQLCRHTLNFSAKRSIQVQLRTKTKYTPFLLTNGSCIAGDLIQWPRSKPRLVDLEQTVVTSFHLLGPINKLGSYTMKWRPASGTETHPPKTQKIYREKYSKPSDQLKVQCEEKGMLFVVHWVSVEKNHRVKLRLVGNTQGMLASALFEGIGCEGERLLPIGRKKNVMTYLSSNNSMTIISVWDSSSMRKSIVSYARYRTCDLKC